MRALALVPWSVALWAMGTDAVPLVSLMSVLVAAGAWLMGRLPRSATVGTADTLDLLGRWAAVCGVLAFVGWRFSFVGPVIGLLGFASLSRLGVRFLALSGPLVLALSPYPFPRTSAGVVAVAVGAGVLALWGSQKLAAPREGLVSEVIRPDGLFEETRLHVVGVDDPGIARLVPAVVLAMVAVVVAALLGPRLDAASAGDRDGDSAGVAAPSGWGIDSDADILSRPNRDDRVVAWSWSQGPDYWRATTMDQWDGRFWASSAVVNEELTAGPDLYAAPLDPLDLLDPDVGYLDVEDTLVYAVGGSTMLLARGTPSWAWVPQPVVRQRTDGTLVVDEPFEDSDYYWIGTELARPTTGQMRAGDPAEVELDPELDRYLEHSAVSERVVALAAEITAGEPTSYDRMRALEEWFDDNIRYDLDSAVPPTGTDPLEFMLFDDRRGYCEQVATAMALMARSQGIPTRVAAGFTNGEFVPGAEYRIIRSENAHAWVEGYFPGVGWTPFDPTDGLVPVPASEREDIDMGLVLWALGVVGVLLIAAWVVAALLRVGDPQDWDAGATARLYRLAFPGEVPARSATIEDCGVRLRERFDSPDDIGWLVGRLNAGVYGQAVMDDASRVRCDEILDDLELAASERERVTRRDRRARLRS